MSPAESQPRPHHESHSELQDDRDLTISEVAGLLNCSSMTVRRRMDQGLLSGQKDGHLLRFKLSEVRRYRDSRPLVQR